MILIAITCAAIAWFTFNLARLEWRRNNRAGATVIAGLALTVFLFPTLLAYARS